MTTLTNKRSKVLKVVHILPSLYNGGTEQIVFDSLSRLNPGLFECYVCLTHEDGDPAQVARFRRAGIKVNVLQRTNNHKNRLLCLIKYMYSTRCYISHIHAYEGNETYARIASIIARVPVILTHDHDIHWERVTGFSKLLWSLLNCYTAHNIAISEACSIYRKSCCGGQKSKVLTIKNGIDMASFKNISGADRGKAKVSLGISPGTKVIGAMGRLVPWKRFDLFINAAKLVTQTSKELHFLLRGSGALETDLRNHANDSGLNNFQFIEWLPHVQDFINSLDVFVITSTQQEGFGLVVAEAMASGIPVVAVKNSTTEEIITPDCGILVDATPESIADGILRILKDESLAVQLSVNGRQRALEQFDIKRTVKELETLYAGAIKEKHCGEIAC